MCIGQTVGTLYTSPVQPPATVIRTRQTDLDNPLDQQLQSDKPKLALGGKAVCAGMGTKYKSAGDQLAIVSHRLQYIITV